MLQDRTYVVINKFKSIQIIKWNEIRQPNRKKFGKIKYVDINTLLRKTLMNHKRNHNGN